MTEKTRTYFEGLYMRYRATVSVFVELVSKDTPKDQKVQHFSKTVRSNSKEFIDVSIDSLKKSYQQMQVGGNSNVIPDECYVVDLEGGRTNVEFVITPEETEG